VLAAEIAGYTRPETTRRSRLPSPEALKRPWKVDTSSPDRGGAKGGYSLKQHSHIISELGCFLQRKLFVLSFSWDLCPMGDPRSMRRKHDGPSRT
jgi:hypothetical protein